MEETIHHEINKLLAIGVSFRKDGNINLYDIVGIDPKHIFAFFPVEVEVSMPSYGVLEASVHFKFSFIENDVAYIYTFSPMELEQKYNAHEHALRLKALILKAFSDTPSKIRDLIYNQTEESSNG